MTSRAYAARLLMVVDSFGTGLVWTTETVCGAMGCSRERAEATVAWLVRRGYMERSRSELFVTSDGREFVDLAISQSRVRSSIRRWKNEVLTGITEDGEPTTITNAVLPTRGQVRTRNASPEAIIMRAQIEQRAHAAAAKALGITVTEYHVGLTTGRIHICTAGEIKHIGIFDRAGKGWRSMCRACRKKRRTG